MRLDSSQLHKIIHNVLSYSVDEQGSLHFHKFTEAQRQVYARMSPDWDLKTQVSASVTFDFVTDSRYITLEFDLSPGTSQRWGSFDLYVDGVFCASEYARDLGLKRVEFALPEGQHRVTVYLPWSVQTVVHGVDLSDGASVISVEKKCKLLCFGDSITQGFITRFTSLSYVNQIARALDAEVINQGIGGYHFNEASLDETIGSYGPDIITVAYGTNDYSLYETVEAFAQRSEKYINKLAALFPNAKILGILPIYRNDQLYQERKRSLDYGMEDIREVLRSQYEALPNGFALEQTGIPHISQVYAPDFLHPNEWGFSIMSQGIIQKLREIM